MGAPPKNYDYPIEDQLNEPLRPNDNNNYNN